jgi:hypothetical protein
MAFLYINNKGEAWRKHSYSAGNDFDQCPLKYYLRRVMGWKEKEKKARFLFGTALEQAIQWHHDHAGVGAVDAFIRNWEPYKGITDIGYTNVEKDWDTLLLDGIEMVKLYIIRQPSLPIPLGSHSAFQRVYHKEVFPGDPNYGEIIDEGKLDIVTYVNPNHPMLTKIDWNPAWGALRPLIVDIKTAAQDFPETAGIAAFDTQLRRYSWQSGHRDVALLWFKKSGRSLKKGLSITLLEDAGTYKAGQEAVIAKVDGDVVYFVHNDFMLEEMERAQGYKGDKVDQTNAAKARAIAWLEQNGTKISLDKITRQRLQFNTGRVTQESADDAGLIAARQIVGIVNAWKAHQWPNTFGIRYPHDDRNDPYFRAFVIGEEAYKNQYFKQSDEETLDDLFADDETEMT